MATVTGTAISTTSFAIVGDGSPLPGCVYEHTSIYGRCCSAEIYTLDAILLKYIRAMLFCLSIIIMNDVVLLEYIRAMLGVATPGSGDPKPNFPSCSNAYLSSTSMQSIPSSRVYETPS